MKKGRYQPARILKMNSSRNKISTGLMKYTDSKSQAKTDSKNSSLSQSKYRSSKYEGISENTSISCKTSTIGRSLRGGNGGHVGRNKRNITKRFKLSPGNQKIKYEMTSTDQQRGELRASRNKDFKKSAKSISVQEVKFNIKKGFANVHRPEEEIDNNDISSKFKLETDKSRINQNILLISSSYDASKSLKNAKIGKFLEIRLV